MFKKLVLFSISSISQVALAANAINLYQAPLSNLTQYSFIQHATKRNIPNGITGSEPHQLQIVSQTKVDSKTILRYQQLYKGIPVVGAQITIMKKNNASISTSKDETTVNGHLFDAIDMDAQPSINSQTALNLAKKQYLSHNPQSATTDEESQLQIRATDKDDLQLVYLVSFKSSQAHGALAWPFFIVNAHDGKIIKQWNNIKTYEDTGPGGNDKVHEYWYGKDGLPPLNVTRNGDTCKMDDSIVRLVNLEFQEDILGTQTTAWAYPCDNNSEDRINGAFSPINDAYYFGHTIVDMYKNWYGFHALQKTNGEPMLLIMRVHYGEEFDNAFWDGSTMSFGDGKDFFYPLISLEVAGHEVSHGFTEQHSGLEYHDESGALNESFSDMAGQATRAYLLENNPALYNKSNVVPNQLTWGIGESIIKESFGQKALRFMDEPSTDENSADCLDKSLAHHFGANCKISYDELVARAQQISPIPEYQQSYIVHTASGVFNKAFYLLSEKIGIKNAYHIMLIANAYYWTPTTDFKNAACGVLYAGHDLNSDIPMIKSIFDQVGVDTKSCAI